MKLTLGWLREHLDTDVSLDALVDRLTMLGLEVEDVIDRGADLKPFTVGYVESVVQHPNADRLRVCTVKTGSDVLDVVCGAPNARTGIKGVFAPIGARIPGTGMVLESRPIRGVTGYGMLCSEREMGLSDEHEGIIELPDDAPIGAPFATVMGLDDPVIDIAITPDRGDCLGVAGIARDLAAAGVGKLTTRAVASIDGGGDSPIGVRLVFDDQVADACSLFVGRLITGVENGPSPAWLRQRLTAVGLRPISALVDITNYVMLDRNRPLHVFDADSLAGHVHVRLARNGEQITALDDVTYTLNDQVTVVADDDGPIALGGVIGGESTGCTQETVNVFLESAVFDPARTAQTGRALGIESDARYRFERGIDASFAAAGADMATRLILDLCGGEAQARVIAGQVPDRRRTISFRPARVHALGGLDVSKSESIAILDALGFDSRADGKVLSVSLPPWRPDIDGEADLVEEVLRVRGYDRIPAVSMARDGAVAVPALDRGQRRVRLSRRVLASRGLNECVTWSFVAEGHAALFGGGKPALKLDNPISADLAEMRPSILPHLIAAAGRNVDRGFATVGLFEVGPQYADDTPDGQATVAAGVRRGQTGDRHWLAPPRDVDAFDAKADVFAVLSALGAPVERLSVSTDAPGWYHPGQSGVLRLGPKTALANFGSLHPGVLVALDVTGPMIAFEIMIDAVPMAKAKPTKARPAYRVSDFPTVTRDFAFLVDDHVPVEKMLRAVRDIGGKPPHKIPFGAVTLFDVYSGDGVAAGKRSVAFSVVLQPTERTLTEEDIQGVSQAIVARVTKTTGAELRG